MQQKKIIIIGPAYPLRGGIANFNEALCRSFLEEGHQCKIFSFSLQYPSFLFPGTSQTETEGSAPVGLEIETCINSVNPLSWITTAKKIRSENPDIVIIRYWLPFMGPCLGTIARLIKRSKTIKIIAITDNIIPHEKRIGDKQFTQYFVKPIDGFVAMSKSVLDDLEKFTTNQNKVFSPHPIYNIFGEKISKQDALKQLNLSPTDKHILFFGFIRRYKGLDLLLEAMGKQQVRSTNAKLIIAGEFYEDDKYYHDLIKQYNLTDRVLLHTHYIPKDEVKYYFCAADLIAQTYHTATQSGVTQIAYHFERPCLVTNVGGLAEIIPDNKVGFVTETNAESIANAIAKFYNENLEATFSNNMIEEKKRFLWNAFVEKVLGLFGKKI